MTLVVALGTMTVLSLSAVAAIDYSSSNARTASYSRSNEGAFALAEAGINNAMAVLSKPQNNALDPNLLPPRRSDYEGGYVVWSGVLDQLSATWTLTSVGRTRNPTGGSGEVARKVTARVPVVPTNTQPYNSQNWNYIMSTQVTGGECDMTIDQTAEVGTRVFVFGNLCLQNQGKIFKGPVVVQGRVKMFSNQNQIGSATDPVSELHVGAGCTFTSNVLHNPCLNGPAPLGDNVWAMLLSRAPQPLVAPSPNWDDWYVNGSPGPYFGCEGVRDGMSAGTRPTFDNDQASATATVEVKRATRNNSVSTAFNLTPSSSSYSCKNANGELSWDAVNKKLYVGGTVFVDGDLTAEFNNRTAIEYVGTASIYVSGSLKLKNINFCGGLSGSDCDFALWNPNTEMLAFVVNGQNRQAGVDAGVGIQLTNASFQGALFATAKTSLDTTSRSDGPIVAAEVMVGQGFTADNFVAITNVPAGMPGAPTVYAQPNAPEMFSG